MTTLATIAAEYNMQPYELAAFLDLGRGVDYEAELDGEDAENIIEILEYDRKHNH
jgi:hypothetical protein